MRFKPSPGQKKSCLALYISKDGKPAVFARFVNVYCTRSSGYGEAHYNGEIYRIQGMDDEGNYYIIRNEFSKNPKISLAK